MVWIKKDIIMKKTYKTTMESDMVAHGCNPSTQEAEAGESQVQG
jgi:hypothetical protein